MSKVNITELIDASSVLEIHMKLVSQRSQYFTHIHEGILDLILILQIPISFLFSPAVITLFFVQPQYIFVHNLDNLVSTLIM